MSLGRYLWERAFQASQIASGDDDGLLGSPVPGRRPLKPELTAALLAYCRVAEVVGSIPVCPDPEGTRRFALFVYTFLRAGIPYVDY